MKCTNRNPNAVTLIQSVPSHHNPNLPEYSCCNGHHTGTQRSHHNQRMYCTELRFVGKIKPQLVPFGEQVDALPPALSFASAPRTARVAPHSIFASGVTRVGLLHQPVYSALREPKADKTRIPTYTHLFPPDEREAPHKTRPLSALCKRYPRSVPPQSVAELPAR